LKRYDIFLSYHSTDETAVENIAKVLVNRGAKPFLDKWNMKPGQPWLTEIEAALQASRAFGAIIGPAGLGPIQVAEMRAALYRMFRERGYPVIPILLPGADPAKRSSLPSFLAQQTWVDLRGGLDNKKELERLLSQIHPQKASVANNYGQKAGQSKNPKKTNKAALLKALVLLESEDLVYLAEISGIRRAEISKDGIKTLAVSLINRAEIFGLLEELQTNLIIEYPAIALKAGLTD
jgi:hypothetical protein